MRWTRIISDGVSRHVYRLETVSTHGVDIDTEFKSWICDLGFSDGYLVAHFRCCGKQPPVMGRVLCGPSYKTN